MKDLALKYLQPLAVSLCAVFAPIKGTVITANLVIVVDLITGILAAKKRGEKITSAAWRRTVSKFLIYNTAILIGFLVEKYLVADLFPITQVAAGLIGSTEALSIYENLNTISDNKIFNSIVQKLGSVNDVKKVDAPSDAPKE